MEDLYEEAVKIVREEKRGSTSLLQRKLRIGYLRASQLIDSLVENGVLKAKAGYDPKPYEVLPTK
jgi:S-DNA-T family DNA segregation ATPase FtsK/SpoIIIE